MKSSTHQLPRPISVRTTRYFESALCGRQFGYQMYKLGSFTKNQCLHFGARCLPNKINTKSQEWSWANEEINKQTWKAETLSMLHFELFGYLVTFNFASISLFIWLIYGLHQKYQFTKLCVPFGITKQSKYPFW